MELGEAIEERASIKKFSSKKPDWRDIIEALHASQYAPMAGGMFSMKFVFVDDKKLIERIAKWSEQDFILQAKYVVVAVSVEKNLKNLYKEKAQKFSRQQAGAAIENFLLSLTEKGLSTCWIGHFNEEKVKELLKIPEENTIEAIFPIGYAKGRKKKRERKGQDYYTLFFNSWGLHRMRKVEKIEARGPEGYGWPV